VESGTSEAEIQRIFRTKIPMKVFSWKGPVDTVLSPLDSIRYMKSFYQCGLLSVEPQTGFVKAWVGGIDYAHFQYDHVAQGQRQVGSTFKPFVYAAAMEQKKFSPCMEVPNQKVCIQAGEFGLTEDWCPSNSDNEYGGLLTLKQALAKSVNTITTYLMKQIGPQAVVQLARALGMTSDLPEVPSIALGTVDLTVEEMVGAYTAFGNGGVYTKPIVITRIEDKNGVVLDEFVPESHEALSPEVAYAVTSLLSGVTEYGTGARLRSSGGGYPDNVVTGFPYAFTNPIAGKTGTTQNNSDGWFMGMVPNLITGVWTGCDDRAAHFGSTVFGQGATTALPVWALYMRKCYADPALGVRSNAFDLPSTPMTIRTDCKAAAAEAATDEWSEFD
jgi:penicillin-binding protein 1A